MLPSLCLCVSAWDHLTVHWTKMDSIDAFIPLSVAILSSAINRNVGRKKQHITKDLYDTLQWMSNNNIESIATFFIPDDWGYLRLNFVWKQFGFMVSSGDDIQELSWPSCWCNQQTSLNALQHYDDMMDKLLLRHDNQLYHTLLWISVSYIFRHSSI